MNPKVVMGLFDIYAAPEGTAWPAINAAPSNTWKKLAISGKKAQTDAGIKFENAQTVEVWRGGSTAIQQLARTEEDLKVSMEVADMSHEALSYALNNNAVTSDDATSGVAGKKTVSLSKGSEVKTFALLIRGKTPYAEPQAGVIACMQIQLPRVFQSGNSETSFTKGSPALIPLEFTSVEGPNATETDPDLGQIISYTAPAAP